MSSLRGQKYHWHSLSADKKDILFVASKYNLSMPIAQTIVARGYRQEKAIEEYLFSSWQRDVAHPSLLKDCLKAVQRIKRALENNEKILVFGDYDVDGITSSALMMLCLKPLGANINFFLPNRLKDGYGLSSSVVERAAQNGYSVIITVDNGITAFEQALQAKNAGIDLIITDHHRPHDILPQAYAIINPHQEECQYPYKKFAGVGVAFKLLSLLYEHLNKSMPPKAFELLLLGTIADVVPLTGENRFWVRHSLHYVNAAQSYAFTVLKKNGNISKERVLASDIGYNVTPQINALGRLQDARQGVKFLIGDDEQEIDTVGKILVELNHARKDIERGILSEVSDAISEKKIDLSTENIIIAASDNWPAGVIGLVASRLVAAHGRPALLFHVKDGKAKGSCRSIKTFNIFDALHECKDLLETFGGHSVAAGLSLRVENIPLLKERLEKILRDQVKPEDLEQKLFIDASLELSDLTKKIIDDMNHLEPFGSENPQPIFSVFNVTLVQPPTLMKDLHVKCLVFSGGVMKPVVFFNRPELFEAFRAQGQEPFSIAVHISENYWNDKVTIELIGIDVAGLVYEKK